MEQESAVLTEEKVSSRRIGGDPEAGAKGLLGILVVDDDEDFAELLTMFLGREPATASVVRARSIAQGVHLTRELHPDVALIDYHLPDGNGATAAALIRELRPGAVVIVLSAGASEEEIILALAAGADLYLSKTSSLFEIRAAVLRLAARRPHLRMLVHSERQAASRRLGLAGAVGKRRPRCPRPGG